MTDPRLAVVVLAAGEGTRMRSRRAKVLHPIAGLPMIAHVLQTARHLEPAYVEVVVRHQRDDVAAAVREYLDDAIVVDQDDVPGTGRAVELAVEALPADFDGDVVVVSGDVPLLDAVTLGALLEQHRAAAASATILSAVLDDATGYGRIVRDADGSVTAIVEHKDADETVLAITEINSGSYVFAASALRELLPQVGSANAQGEKYLTDVVALLRQTSAPVAAVPVTENWRVAGVNDRSQLAEQAARLNAMIVRGHQLNGVTIHDPATTWIDLTVSIGQDAEIWPNTRLAGATTIERDASIGPDTTLVDCEIGEGAVVKRTDATLAVVKAYAEVGPFAYLRPGTELAGGGKIGTFVETKNAKIGRGSKVPHLSYIGDTEVGEGSNIGAGTITANYDGVDKHRTTVGSHVRTGSHNVFVAPVTIGDGAYSGAGTVIRKDVPPGALAVNVAPQRNIDRWVAANRPGTAAADAAAAAPSNTSE
ncbi:bifunctional UDP-N-acetylglucosamine diphosphorylase/glucosamine-1-phosphate N-acetyltransferase GlmU [Protaetiibacter sp. SSC-01]|uniref:bifunctional UDP-N-acetylglucosamine diphosphorylase/glucosamine-1-phosphate N-acetyltransferase GlmU n=1 Tax=Protaetiibacter sp. SSC-01 TaxID=2759943 RepID=UPI0016576214|nr:bifunctional UDP-N-acetylglucosamine diphosphorylase/glucosamine-1-phosphate N-acetyltransferase GlmU [Protaetiibacter sp. SSC-01]QNO38131.1 bifunctional UDP-N-acetylglucosamine diphosphorylase/glucosamine-1-phosphate N-acetyltransferase GlmU [Protaetiibacter sp. SSC-01]